MIIIKMINLHFSEKKTLFGCKETENRCVVRFMNNSPFTLSLSGFAKFAPEEEEQMMNICPKNIKIPFSNKIPTLFRHRNSDRELVRHREGSPHLLQRVTTPVFAT